MLKRHRRHSQTGRKVTIPHHTGDLAEGTLRAILREAGIAAIDAMKIDIEGAEDLALAPFLEAAPQALLPRLLLIEVRPADWRVDLSALLRRRGYIIATRSRHNAVWRLA